jgi:NifB/MoaA-like Fe-S oxidoreductase
VRFLQRRIREDAELFAAWAGQRIGVVTGTAMGGLMGQVLAPLALVSGAEFELIVVANGLFGRRVTTAGLLPGKSIAEALRDREELDLVLLPAEAVNDELLFIDGLSAEALAAGLALPIRFSKYFSDAVEAVAAA